MLWIIWKMAEPQTTKMKRASSQGPTCRIQKITMFNRHFIFTGYFSWSGFVDLGTLPLAVMFFLDKCQSLIKLKINQDDSLRLGVRNLHPLLSSCRHLCKSQKVFQSFWWAWVDPQCFEKTGHWSMTAQTSLGIVRF